MNAAETELPHDRAALVAAAQSTEATAELLRFVREGAHAFTAFGEIEVVEKLAEALLHAARIESDYMADTGEDTEYRSEVDQLASACARFIAGWAG